MFSMYFAFYTGLQLLLPVFKDGFKDVLKFKAKLELVILTNYIVLLSITVNLITNLSMYHPQYMSHWVVFSLLNTTLLFFAHTSNWFSSRQNWGELIPEGQRHKGTVSTGSESSFRGSFHPVACSCPKVFSPISWYSFQICCLTMLVRDLKSLAVNWEQPSVCFLFGLVGSLFFFCFV